LVRSAPRVAALGALLLILGACVPICGIGAKFSVSNAHVDSNYNCPYPSENRPYDVHATIDASNTLSNTVTIKSIAENDELVNTVGAWEGPKTAKGSGAIKDYSPKSVGSGSNATIKFSVPFQCTNTGPSATTYGEFTFKFTLTTSAGTYTISAGDRHRLSFPSS